MTSVYSHFVIYMTFNFFFRIESPKSYISEDAGSPCSVDPNAMDVDSVGSPPTMVNLPCKLTRSQRGNIV